MASPAFRRKVEDGPLPENIHFKRWGVPTQRPLILYLAHTRVGLGVGPIPPSSGEDQRNGG